MRKIIFLSVIIFELAVISFLAVKIYLYKQQVLGENVSINPILKDDVIFPNQDRETDLKYFYEPKPNRIKSKNQNGYQMTIIIQQQSMQTV